METKYKVIRNWNGTENKNATIVFEDGEPIGCKVYDVYSGEESVSTDYTFEVIVDKELLDE